MYENIINNINNNLQTKYYGTNKYVIIGAVIIIIVVIIIVIAYLVNKNKNDENNIKK